MSKIGKVTFDLENNRVQVNHKRINGVCVSKNTYGKVASNQLLPPRRENVIAL